MVQVLPWKRGIYTMGNSPKIGRCSKHTCQAQTWQMSTTVLIPCFAKRDYLLFENFQILVNRGGEGRKGASLITFSLSPSVLLIPYFLIQYWYIVFLLTSHSFHWPFQLYSLWLNFQHFLHCYRFSLFLILFFISFLLQNTCSLQPIWKPKKHKKDKTLLKSRIQ